MSYPISHHVAHIAACRAAGKSMVEVEFRRGAEFVASELCDASCRKCERYVDAMNDHGYDMSVWVRGRYGAIRLTIPSVPDPNPGTVAATQPTGQSAPR
jgi:hypothetical protein